MSGVAVFADVQGMASLRDKMRGLVKRLGGARAQSVHMTAARIMRDKARQLAPVFQGEPRKGAIVAPGALRAAIYAAHSREAGDTSAIVGVNYGKAANAFWVEFGTSKMPAQPYMRPALAATRDEMIKTINGGYTEILNDN